MSMPLVNQTPTSNPPGPQLRQRRFVAVSWRRRNRRKVAYALALLGPVAVLLVQLELGYQYGDAPRLFLFFIPILVCAYAGGLGPGMLATLISAGLSDYFMLRPPGGPAWGGGLLRTQWQLLVLQGGFISVMLEAWNRSLTMHRAILDSSLDAIIVFDHRGRILEFNPAAERIFGHAADTAVGTELAGLIIPPAQRDQHRAEIARYLTSGQSQMLGRRLEMSALRADGTEVPVELSIQRVEHSNPPRFTGFIRNLSKRREAEVALRQSEARFRQLIENASDMVSVVSAKGVILFQGPSTPRLIGYTPDEMLDRPMTDFIHSDDHAKVGEVLGRVLAGQQKPEALEFRLRHQDGTWRNFQSFGKTMTGPDGERQIVVNSRDITDSRTMEEQLRQSQKMEAIGQLSAGVAHDFNNLLTVIQGHIGLLKLNGSITPESAGSIRDISAAADRAARLTRQLLTFSRQQVMQQAEHNLNSLVANLGKMLRRLVNADIELVFECSVQPLPLRADEGMVEQVLLNLVVNARDAMPRGGRLRVATEALVLEESAARLIPQARPGTFACLTVSDTGIGIAPDILPRIFEPFFTTKEVGKGTGLGLATIYGVMQQHDGWISVESSLGGGSTFRAYFPLLRLFVPVTNQSSHPAIRGGHETILFVEDETSVRKMGEIALAGLGYRVITAVDGMDGLQLWQLHQHEIDLVLTDLVMPGGVNGRELAERLKADRPTLRVIFTSGYSHEVAGQELRLEEGRNFLPKPYDMVGLARIIRASLDEGLTQPPFSISTGA